MYYYKVFGFIVGSPSKLNWPVELIDSSIEIACEIEQVCKPISKPGFDLIYTSPIITSSMLQPRLQIFSSPDGLFVSYPEIGHCEIRASKITYYLYHQSAYELLEAFLFRVVFILWLELIGVPVLHASAVVTRNNIAIGLLANSATGKSTLAAAFLQDGAKFLTDDILPIEMQTQGWRAHPSYAWLRLLPEPAEALGYRAVLGLSDSEKYVIPLDKNYGEFFSEPASLGALYLLERGNEDTPVSLEGISPKQAYLGLLRHTFAGNWLMKSPLAVKRMNFFAKLVKEVSIKRIIYPSGYGHLRGVVDALNRDLDS